MNTKQTLKLTAAVLLLSTAQLSTWAQGTAFTYNGQLNDGTNPATGSYDLRFTIYDAATGGTAHGALTNAATGITNGLFTVTLDFGGVFNGANYWLELAARTNGGGAFSPLSPLQPILPAPYAIFSATAGSAATATTAGSANSVSAGNIVGTVPLAQLPAAVVTNNSTGVILNGTFSGNGGGLTNVDLTGPSANSDLGNEANGYQALASNTTGSNNAANGVKALFSNTTGGANTANGRGALASNTTGTANTANGYCALNYNTTAINNVANGSQALYYNTTGAGNTANGLQALFNNKTGSGNAANGLQTLFYNTTGSYNTANGQAALQDNTTGSFNVANGLQALFYNTNGNYNVADGSYALWNATCGSNNIALGYQAGYNLTTGSSNIDIGNLGVATDTNIIRIGSSQTQAFIAGVITGDGSGLTNVNLTGPTAISASGNMANGYHALAANTSGSYNTASGWFALSNNTSGYWNAASGSAALRANTTGYFNTADGVNALYNNTSGHGNTSVGDESLFNNTTGNENAAIGHLALNHNTTGSTNIALGYQAGYNLTTGGGNIDIGNPGLGTDTNIIRIGSGQTQTFIAGVITGDGGGLTNLTVGQLSSAVLTNNASGVTLGGTFSGSGAGLTNLNPTNLSAGTAAINISGNAATATTAANVTGNIADSLLSPNVALLNATNAFTGTNTFAGTVIATNASNVISGTFTGDGSGLTGITLVTPPPGMALIPAGSFTMGNSNGDGEPGMSDATPISVYVSAFYMDANLVSWSQWQSVYFWATNHGYGFVNPGAGKAANHPVQSVDWYDAVKWCNARSQQAGRPPVYYTDALQTQVYTNGEVATLYPNWAASGYRLPTEAEWEKAARGGLSGQRFPWANVITENLANYNGATGSYAYDLGPNGYNSAFTNGVAPYTSPVGYFAANGYGLYDMAGNVFEWCWDWYGTLYAGGSDPHGPAGPLTFRVLRGGDWGDGAYYSRCAYRYDYLPGSYASFFGFRCVKGL